MLPFFKLRLFVFFILGFVAFWYRYSWEPYVNLDKPADIYFCHERSKLCNPPYGKVSCKSSHLCPISSYIYCRWDLKKWHCFADLDFDLEITNTTVECSVMPYGNWALVHSCVLYYDVAPRQNHSYWDVHFTLYGYNWFLLGSLLLTPFLVFL